MMSRDNLPKIANAEREAQYGYVFGVSGPGKQTAKCYIEEIVFVFVDLSSRYG